MILHERAQMAFAYTMLYYVYNIWCVAYPSNFDYRTLGWNECIIGSHAQYTAPIQLAVMRFYSRSLFRLEIPLIRFQICLVHHTKNIWYVNNFDFIPFNRKKRSKSILWMRNVVCRWVPRFINNINCQLIYSFIYLETRMS